MSSGTVVPVPIRQDVLDNLCSRFLINIPLEEKRDPMKLCYHIELAHWFYLDFLRPEEASLPACSFKEFIATVFQHIPLLAVHDRSIPQLAEEYKVTKQRRPVCGGIVLNTQLDKCLLVQGFSTSSWGFPKGKLEDGETTEEAAIRELLLCGTPAWLGSCMLAIRETIVYEEIGLDVRGMVKKDWVIQRDLLGHSNKMFIVPDIPEDTVFATRTRKEIAKIEWFEIAGLPQHTKDQTSRTKLGKSPNNFYLVVPFVKPLREWIDRYHSKLNPPTVRKHGRPGSPRSGSGRRRSGVSASSQRSNSASSKVGGRSASLTAGGGGGRGGGGGSERQLAPAVQQLFDMSVSPLIHTGGGAVPSRGKTEPGTQMRHLQQSSGSSKKGGEVSFGHSSPSQSLLHLLRQGSSQTQHRTPRAPKPSAVDGVVVLATPAYQAPATSTSQDSSAQETAYSLSHFSFQAPAWQNFAFDHTRILQYFEGLFVAQTPGK